MRRNLFEGQGPGRAAEPIEVLGQLEDPSLVDAQPLPHGVAALDGRVERADPRLVARPEVAVDVDEDVAVLLVEVLEHGWSRRDAEPAGPT
ncbi:MAG: hypothetical protein ACYSWT_18420 [Planctomycetota bacterium]